ncbi:ABC transporter permease subunit [Alcanivorax marinus]|uniref:ABC transporter permease subunit n=1 Tax=Alloalcanivorax marinus TaxID=1177169 RepID=A0A9Q3UN79_9GAMM|nr:MULTISPECIES: ABC transporter permease subunit [Alloalcanivorax]MCC4308559.1 ABC transporter permease subunit [Alloalcanivorax marinus]MCE7521620.1 ABC transporter permease subunit [Alloalcanivorax xenomutans]
MSQPARTASSVTPSRLGVRAAARPAARPGRRRDLTALCVVSVLLILAMEVASRFVPPFIMPSPLVVGQAVLELLTSDWHHVSVTLLRLAAAVGFSMLVGVLIGLLMGTSRRLGPYLNSLVIIDTGIPALSWMLVAVFWFKDPEARIFFILTVILLPFYALNVYEGVRSMPKEWVDMMESFRPSRWQLMRYLVIPHIVQYVFMTTKSVIGYAIRMVIFAELVASAVGVGSRMSLAQSTFRIDYVLAWTFLLVVLNLVLQSLLNLAERHVLKWRAEAKVR